MSTTSAQIISLTMGGIDIAHIKAEPNRWGGHDLALNDRGRTLRITVELGLIEVFTFDGFDMETKATFTFETPPFAIAAYVGALLTNED